MRKAATFIAAISVIVWGAAASSVAARSLPRLLRMDVSSSFAVQPATMSFGCCGQFVIGGPGVSTAAFRSGRLGHIRWKLWASAGSMGVGLLWVDNCVPSCPSGAFQSRPVSIEASRVVDGRHTRLLLIYRSGNRRIFDWRKLERVPGLKRPAYQWTHGGRVPSASTGGASSITQSSATVSGTVNPNGRSTTYYFQYGTTTSYGSTTASQAAGSGATTVNVSANLSALTTGATYRYRLDASNAAGIAYGSDRTFATVMTTQQLDANRAVATYGAMQQYFYAASVYPGDTSSLYTENYPQSGRRYSFLWPFSRALAGTITLSGIPSVLVGGASYQADVADRLMGLSRCWDSMSTPPGYDSYPPAPYGSGGDKYYDDQSWVGLAAAQNYAMTKDPTSLADAKNVFNFVYPGGWAAGASFEPGGTYWVQQGAGVGLANHDRTTTSNAPNAEIALLLENFDPANAAPYDTGASAMYGWVNHYLYNVGTNPTDPNAPNPNYAPNQPALMFDKVTGSNTIDETLYTYNQGTMIAANVREYQKTGNSAYLSNAEAIANTALSTFNETYYINHSAAFNAIFFRGLLVLYSVTSDTNLQSNIIQTIQTYADDAWNNHRSSNGLFSFASSSGTGYQLLDQGAMLQIYAMLAWNSNDYAKLP
jgi:glycosyl hydrolase family 76